MPHEKNTLPSRQASGSAQNRHRLSQEEWDREWDKAGPWLVAGFALFCLLITLMETGVAL